MFPIPWNKAFRKKDGTLVNMADAMGGGGSFTPDYENEIIVVGIQGDYEYYLPMSKRYIGEGIAGYRIKTNPESSMNIAMIDLYSIQYAEAAGGIADQTLIKTLVHNGDKTYSDDFISVSYQGSEWSVSMLQTMYKTSGETYSNLAWSYSTLVDYTLLTEDPTEEVT